jgi:hypothetical protein
MTQKMTDSKRADSEVIRRADSAAIRRFGYYSG